MKKVFLSLACFILTSAAIYAEDPEMKRQYEKEQEKCQKYGGGKNAVYKGTTYGSSSTSENKGATVTIGGNMGGKASVGTSTKAEGSLGANASRTSTQQNQSNQQNTNNRWECE